VVSRVAARWENIPRAAPAPTRARMAAELGADPVLCCLAGGETGSTLAALLAAMPGERRVVPTEGASGCYVIDRREGERHVVAIANRRAPRRHEVDDLVAATTASALSSAALVIANPFPPGDLPGEAFTTVAGNAAAAGVPVIVDLSSPRLECTLGCRPAIVKLNDWELAEYVCGPVDGPRAPATSCATVWEPERVTWCWSYGRRSAFVGRRRRPGRERRADLTTGGDRLRGGAGYPFQMAGDRGHGGQRRHRRTDRHRTPDPR
jgi:hypothetical protein